MNHAKKLGGEKKNSRRQTMYLRKQLQTYGDIIKPTFSSDGKDVTFPRTDSVRRQASAQTRHPRSDAPSTSAPCFSKWPRTRANECIKGIKFGRTRYGLLRLKYALKHFSVEGDGI